MKNHSVSEKILACAANALKEWECSGATLDDCLGTVRSERPGEKGACASILFEYFRHKGFLDSLIAQRASRGCIKRELRVVIACALTQALFQTAIAPESAVNVAVEFIKKHFGKGPAAFANAVLRSILRSDEVKNIPSYSFPPGLEQRWTEEFGAEKCAEIIRTFACNPELSFRLRKAIPAGADFSSFRKMELPAFADGFEFFSVPEPEKLFVQKQLFEDGVIYIQDPATCLAISLLKGEISGKILDACAAPGGKTILLSDLAKSRNAKVSLTAIDRSSQRLHTLKSNLNHAGVSAVMVQASAQEHPFPEQSFDLILADVPCGNSGVLRRRSDAPWRFSSQKLTELVVFQADILDCLARLVKPGGRLLYSTCSIEEEEDEIQVSRFLESHSSFRLIRKEKLFPSSVHDGAFAALLERKSEDSA